MTDKNDELIRRGDALAEVEITSHPNETSYAPHLYDRIAALPAVQPVVTVKPLVWFMREGRTFVAKALQQFDAYQVVQSGAHAYWGRDGEGWSEPLPTLEAAKAAAQADYAARILAALDVQPAPVDPQLSPSAVDASPAPETDPKVAALVEAGKYLSDVIDVLLDDCRSQTDDVIIKTITGAKIRSVADARAALAAWEGRGNE
jgi:hypothetical protein